MNANWTGQQLSIDHPGNGGLVASHATANLWIFPAVLLAFAVAALLASLRFRQIGAIVFSGLWIAGALAWLFLFTGTTVSSMSIDAGNRLSWSRTFRGVVKEQKTANLADFATVDLDQNKSGRRLILVQLNGASVLPLGDDWLWDERLYLLRDEVRERMNRGGSASQSR